MTPKRSSAVFLVLIFSAAFARAEGANEVSGYSAWMWQNSGRANARGFQKTVSGVSYGGTYLRSVTPLVSAGVALDLLQPGDRQTSSFAPNISATGSIGTVAALAVVRIARPEGKVRPSFLAGAGAHVTSVRLDAHPNPGAFWPDTHTTETRTLVDSSAVGPSLKLQGGVDFPLGHGFLAGPYAALNLLGSTTYQGTAAGRKVGLNSVSGRLLAISLGFAVAGRF